MITTFFDLLHIKIFMVFTDMTLLADFIDFIAIKGGHTGHKMTIPTGFLHECLNFFSIKFVYFY
jgi:hypothetical protein